MRARGYLRHVRHGSAKETKFAKIIETSGEVLRFSLCSPARGTDSRHTSHAIEGQAMARPAPLRNPRDRFRIVEEDEAQEDLSPGGRDDRDRPERQSDSDMEARVEPGFDWPEEMDEAPVRDDPPRQVIDEADAPLEPAIAAQVETSPAPSASPAKPAGGIGVIPLIIMALIAGTLSAAVVLYLF
jgi:hypothetical protein